MHLVAAPSDRPRREGSRTRPGRARRRLLPALLALLVATAGLAAVDPAGSASAVAAGSGRATHYSLGPDGSTTNGNCSLPAIPADRLYVAVGPDDYAGSAACGTYLDVTGPTGTVRVVVADLCPECEKGHLDLSEEAFRAIGDFDAGIIPISYAPVAAPTVPPLAFRLKEGSSAYWAAIQVVDAGTELRSVEVRVGTAWVPLSRTVYGYWLAPSGLGAGPYTVRVTDVTGRTATVPGIALDPMRLQRTTARLG
ncbi:expansin EXLX1 family cellulose-binding protein [Clavibacter michiganensis]|uniref:expansin EXLX1 family cellulose-binding protein n=1 Tax=Clavibacter michiganensis TaxID=28447 RepID=UPI000689B3F4|nr:expansin EXLX1 family cellulose-binding protein [Clavibacter michiganensis]